MNNTTTVIKVKYVNPTMLPRIIFARESDPTFLSNMVVISNIR